jgi:serine protease
MKLLQFAFLALLHQINAKTALRQRQETDNTRSLSRVWIHCKEDHHEKCLQAVKEHEGDDLSIMYDFEDTNAIVVTATDEKLRLLQEHPHVKTTTGDAKRYPHMIKPTAESIQRHELDGALFGRDLQFDGQEVPYGVSLVQADLAWQVGATGKNIKVCVIDTGLDSAHEDINADNTGGVALPFAGQWDVDIIGHGTATSGIIMALNNDIGVVGAAPDATVFAVKVFDDENAEFVYVSALVDAAYRCRDAGAKIISMSLGGDIPFESEAQVLWDLYELYGILSIASSGNWGDSTYSYPASYQHVISVGAIDADKNLADFSQFNDMVDLVAPGVGVLTTLPSNESCLICDEYNITGYAPLDGTSFSAPYVAGVAALVWSYFPEASVQDIETALLDSAIDLGRSGRDNDFGHGLVSAWGALEQLNGRHIAGGPLVTPDGEVCQDGEVLVEVSLKTDRYGNETSWEIVRDSDGFTVLGGYNLKDRTRYKTCVCLPANCYTFTIHDSRSDGYVLWE